MNLKEHKHLSSQMTRTPSSPSLPLSASVGVPPDQTPVPARAPRRRLTVPARWYSLPLALLVALGLVLVGTGRLDEKLVSNLSSSGSQLLAPIPSLPTLTPAPTRPPDHVIARPLPAPYNCSSMTNYYIEQNGGSDSYDGRADVWDGTHGPWKTISHANDVLSGGAKCVNVGPGTYTGEIYTAKSGSSDTPTGYFVWRSLKPHQAILQEPTQTKITAVFFCDTCKYVVIDGFTINGNLDGFEQGIAFFGTYGGHHIKILNNVVANLGDHGIDVYAVADTTSTRNPYGYDYVTIAGNVVHDVGQSGVDPGASDGIVTYHQVTLDTRPGFHTMIYNNIVYNVGYPRHPTQATENHCIMLDDLGGQNIPYTSPVLVENNLAYNCSGNGINVYGQFNSLIRNNTFYANCRTADLGYNCGEIEVVMDNYQMDNGQGATIVNNIVDTAGLTTQYGHFALVECTRYGADTNKWYNNLTFNGTPGQPSVAYSCGGTQTPITAAHGNIFGQNPQFHNPSGGDFTLQSTSPAIGAGTSLYPGDPFVDSIDLAGISRPQGKSCNIGAY